jgi:hypothetical protein
MASLINPRPPSFDPAPTPAPAAAPATVTASTPAPAQAPAGPTLADQEAAVARRSRGRAGTVATGWAGAFLEAVGAPGRKRLLGE